MAPARPQLCAPSWAGCGRPKDASSSTARTSARLSPDRIFRKGIGFIPEDRRIFATLTVEENLGLGLFTRWQSGAQQRRELDRIYALFPRLSERRAQFGRTLSGGEQQMLAIGRAMVGSPKLLLVDEPSEGLAPMVVTEISNRLRVCATLGSRSC